IVYQLFFQIQNPGSTLILNDRGSTANLDYSLQATPNAAITVSSYEFLRSDWDQTSHGAIILGEGPLANFILNTGAGNHTISVLSLPPFQTKVAVNGGSASTTLKGPDTANTWKITGPDTGTLDNVINFASVPNLLGGSGSDTFAFKTGGGIAGTIDGG